MIKIKQAIIVEGKYDKIKLSGIIDAPIIQTDGFGIFKDKELQCLIRNLAEKRGILVLTDSDSAGFKIRSFIGSTVDPKNIVHAYIPDIFGKESRKTEPSKEGKLGVEGVSEEIIMKALANAGVLCEAAEEPERPITKLDLYELGFTGGQDSAKKRAALLKYYSFPARLSANALVKVLNSITTYDQFIEDVKEIEKELSE
ncbi:MAG: toprim domain-containing protein [Acutalibacteraceae bacterium]